MRSFGLVEDKVYESDFFLEKIYDCNTLLECRYYINAFASACRSITFSMQSVMKKVPNFEDWYFQRQEALKDNEMARFFVRLRNESQKIGLQYVTSQRSYIDGMGAKRTKFFFSHDMSPQRLVYSLVDSKYEPVSVHEQCRTYLALLVDLVYDCFTEFGPTIDPLKYYEIGNLKRLGKTIEDIEEELGYPRGWTYIEGEDDALRIDMLRQYQLDSSIDPIFIKYLHKRRYDT